MGCSAQLYMARAISAQTASVPETTPSDEDVWACALKPVRNANAAISHFVAIFLSCVIFQ